MDKRWYYTQYATQRKRVLSNLKYESEIWTTKNRWARHKVKGMSEELKDKEMENSRKEITLEDQCRRSIT